MGADAHAMRAGLGRPGAVPFLGGRPAHLGAGVFLSRADPVRLASRAIPPGGRPPRDPATVRLAGRASQGERL